MARPDPLDAQSAVPALVYRSSLATPAAAKESKPLTWRQANDEVGRIGGWRAYAREAQQPDPVSQDMPKAHGHGNAGTGPKTP